MEMYFDQMKRQTDFFIKKAFYECLEQKIPLNVRSLCVQAGIGRRTFYRHYESIDAVFESCIDSLLSAYQTSLHPLETYKIKQIATEFFLFWESKKSELLLLKRYDEMRLSALLFQHGVSLVQNRSKKRLVLFSAYSTGGFLGMLDWWIAEDFRTPAQCVIEQFVQEANLAFKHQ